MATGRLAAQDMSAATLATVYLTPAATYTVASVTMFLIRMSIADNATPTNGEYIEFETGLLSKNILERTGIVLSATQKIVILSSQASVSAVVVGIETAA